MKPVLFSLASLLLFTFPIEGTEGFVANRSSKMVNLYGRVRVSAKRSIGGLHHAGERPADPKTLLKRDQLEEKALKLMDWWQDKSSVLCITGAGLSTESGIPDYRGHKGSYHNGHKPMIHQQYMDSEYQRRRYWGRSLVGWKTFDSAQPNVSGGIFY